MKTAQIIITSCSRRELEIEQMRNFLAGNGFNLSNDEWNTDKNADLIFLSTCGFTKAAEDFGFETLKRITKEKKQSAIVVLCGCIPEINPERTKREFGGITFSPQSYSTLDSVISAEKKFDTFVRPNTIKYNTLNIIKDDIKRSLQLLKTFDGSLHGLSYIQRRLGNAFTRRIISGKYANIKSKKTFYIQIQEGCSMGCSYCSIKTAIGKLRSKPLELILDNFRQGIKLGYKEFQLVGDSAGSYGLDIETNLRDLLQQIIKIKGEFKIDLTDIHPVFLESISDIVIQFTLEKKLSRLYVPIQSGSPRILKLMRRACDMERVREIFKDIKYSASNHGKFIMGTSIIVGFPSETNEDFQQTISFCKDVKFDWIWCHSFSARPETPAANMGQQISSDEIIRRARMVKKELSAHTLVTTADDSAGSRTCQG